MVRGGNEELSAERRVLLTIGSESDWDGVIADLEDEGIKVELGSSGTDALIAALRRPLLIVLDADLPDMDAVTACRALRARSQVPVIVVNDDDRESDVVAALEAGADDCVARPFRVLELCARIRAVIRKAERTEAGSPRAAIEVGDVRIDPYAGEVTVLGRWLHLPAKEFALLALLLANRGKIVRRDFIMQQVWGRDRTADSKTLDAHVNRLRQRLQAAGADSFIETVRGRGYRYETAAVVQTQLVFAGE